MKMPEYWESIKITNDDEEMDEIQVRKESSVNRIFMLTCWDSDRSAARGELQSLFKQQRLCRQYRASPMLHRGDTELNQGFSIGFFFL